MWLDSIQLDPIRNKEALPYLITAIYSVIRAYNFLWKRRWESARAIKKNRCHSNMIINYLIVNSNKKKGQSKKCYNFLSSKAHQVAMAPFIQVNLDVSEISCDWSLIAINSTSSSTIFFLFTFSMWKVLRLERFNERETWRMQLFPPIAAIELAQYEIFYLRVNVYSERPWLNKTI